MKIICIGRNYAAHVLELKNEISEEPIIFLKPETAQLQPRMPFFIPDFSTQIHHEVEVVIKINKTGKHIQEKFAHTYYDEIGIGIDFTARDKQSFLKSKGLPWELAKAFDGSAPTGKFLNKSSFDSIQNISFHLDKNGVTVQQGNTSAMIHSVDKLISFISEYFTLKKGDLIFTGTPEGVGTVKADDILEAYIGNEKLLTVKVK
ncbi:MAG: fumarylacetoacetate hydrolase family protein [Bacteroidetes bacterium]|jgi:2-keto-4-pentenoate hydratase/2-oxohepta-3-ene-1,7-dioic acid hydratase in catechol pathway|nr:fumarylacetoacetate hydrolase family protein [Bacteroidota bacterium]